MADIVAVGGTAPHTFSIASDPDLKFRVSGGDLVTAGVFDFTNSEAHTVTIQAQDSLGTITQETFVIDVVTETTSLLEAVVTETGDGDSAVRVLVGNNEDEPVPVKVVGDGYMRCEKGVFNLVANVPLTILANNLIEICDASFYNDSGERIFLHYKNLVDRIEVCSKKTLTNLEYRIEGNIACPV